MLNHLQQWLVCLKHYALMCLFVSSPARLPPGLHCILLSLFCYAMLGFALVDTERSYIIVLLQILLELGLLALICYAGLKWKDKLPRFSQTFSALVGVNLLLSAISIPVYHALVQQSDGVASVNQAAINVTMLIIFWNLAVLSLIFKRAFDITTLLSAMISFNYFLLYQFIVIWFS